MDVDMQAAIEFFMLGKSVSGVPPSPQKESPRVSDDNYNNRRKKGYRPILKAYQGRIEEWKDTNRQLEGVVGSIVNLRDRIHWESSRLTVFSVGSEGHTPETNHAQKEEKHRQPSWRDCGFRSSLSRHNSSVALSKEDIHSALNHDLLRHERMLSALRSLLASLAKTVDDIGRRLDEWMIQNLWDQDVGMSEDEKMFAARIKEQKALELAQEVYSLLASDLYRKQKMAIRIFDSCHDGVLERGDSNNASLSNDQFFGMSDPRNVIKTASKEFPSLESRDLTWNAVNQLMTIL